MVTIRVSEDALCLRRAKGPTVSKGEGLTTLKLAKVIQFMKDWRILGAALQETWRVTKDSVESEENPSWVSYHPPWRSEPEL